MLFACCEVVQKSIGFSPGELMFGHEMRGPLKVLKERLITPENDAKSLPEYVKLLNGRFLFQENVLAALQTKMKRHSDQRAVDRSFQPRDKVLILLPVPYVVEKARPTTSPRSQATDLGVLHQHDEAVQP